MLSVGGATGLQAQFVWRGGGSTGNIVDHFNWQSSLPGGLGVVDENVTFGTAGQTAVVINSTDLLSAFEVNKIVLHSLTFNGNGESYTFSGTGSPTLQITGDLLASCSNTVVINCSLKVQLAAGVTGDTNNVHTVDVSGNSSVQILANICGNGASLLKTGNGSLELDGNNTFDGGVEVTAGDLFVGSDTAVGSGILKLHGNTELAPSSANVSLANNITLVGDNGGVVENDDGGSNDLTLTGKICGSGSIEWCTTGTLTLANSCNIFTGGVDMREGTLYLGSSSTFSGGVITKGPIGTGQLTMADGTTLGVASEAGPITLHNAIGLEEGSTVTFDTSNGNLTLKGCISGDGGIIVSGSNTLILTAHDNYSDGTTIDRCATLQIGDGGSHGSITGDVTDIYPAQCIIQIESVKSVVKIPRLGLGLRALRDLRG